MKFYLSEIIPRIIQYSKKIDEDAMLLNHDWILFDFTTTSKITYIFRKNNELIITDSGIGRRCKWENMGDQRLLIEENRVCKYYNVFFDETFLILNRNNTNTYAFLINEKKLNQRFLALIQINEYLESKYIIPTKEKNKIKGYITVPWNTNRGRIHIEFERATYPKIKTGLNVFQDEEPAADGKYKVDCLKYIHVRFGMIADITRF
jgi:hypothetical protein